MSHMKKYRDIPTALVIFFTALPARAVELKNPLGTESVPKLINNIIDAVLGFTGAVALLMFIYGGLLWLTSRGAPDKVKKGRDVMVLAAVGLLIIFSSYGLVRFVFRAFSSI